MDSTTQAAFIAATVICGTGALAVLSATVAAAVGDYAAARCYWRNRLGLGPRPALFSYKRNGGLHFVKAGRFGAACWISRKAPAAQ